VDPPGPHLPPLSSEATWRHHLRQEPSALVALAERVNDFETVTHTI
jgi:hypothetical protein